MEYYHTRNLGSNYNGLKNVEKIHVHKNLVASTKKSQTIMNVTLKPSDIIRSTLHVKITLKMYKYHISNNIFMGKNDIIYDLSTQFRLV